MATVPTIETEMGPVPAFDLIEPANPSIPFLFCSPHSGRDYPAEFINATRLSGQAIRRSEDLFVDDLFDFVPSLGAPLLTARFPRAFLDVNREPYELDARMFDEALPAFANAASVRVAGGLGTIPRIVAENQEIYRAPLRLTEGLDRIETIYKPFHATLRRALDAVRSRFGMAILIDCHSMPSSVRALPGSRRSDIVLGDRFGTSAGGRLVQIASDRIADLGYDVARNKPYAGGYITESYGKPAIGFHAIQIEINRGLYADEKRYRRRDGFDRLRDGLERFVQGFAADVAAEYTQQAAAE